jgi:hypothetical protein
VLNITSTLFSIDRQPDGLRELKHRVYFAKDLNGFLEEWSGQLTFWGSEYQYLRSQFISGACGVIPVKIFDGCGGIFNANIFLNDAKWRPDICSVELGVVDDGFLSLIDNNKNIKAYLNVPRSKNDIDITAFTTVQTNCQFLENQIGVQTPTDANREGVRLYDAFKFLIAFMSDGEMDFASTYFEVETSTATPTINRNPTLFDPEELTLGGGTAYPYISFDDLLKDTYRLYNVEFGVEKQVSGRPLFRLEKPEYFKQNSETIFINYPATITQTSDIESYYQKLIIGSSDVLSSHEYYDPIQLFSWDKEEYHLGGKCNSESVLDLQLQTIITDTNIIQDALPIATGGTASESNSGSIAIVVLDGDNITVPFNNPVNLGYQNFNFVLKNDEVLNRFYGAIPSSIYLFLGEGVNNAESQIQSLQTTNLQIVNNPFDVTGIFAELVEFPIEIDDPNNNMAIESDPLEFFTLTNTQCTAYTAPVSSVYSVNFKITSNYDFRAQIGTAYLLTYPAADNNFDQIIPFGDNFIVDTNTIPQLQGITIGSNGTFSIDNNLFILEGSATMFLNSGDRLVVMCTFRSLLSASEGYQNTCFFKVEDGLTIERTFDPTVNYLINTEFEYPIQSGDWNDFLANRYGKVVVQYNNGIIVGYLRDASRVLEDGTTDWKIRSTFNNS